MTGPIYAGVVVADALLGFIAWQVVAIWFRLGKIMRGEQ